MLQPFPLGCPCRMGWGGCSHFLLLGDHSLPPTTPPPVRVPMQRKAVKRGEKPEMRVEHEDSVKTVIKDGETSKITECQATTAPVPQCHTLELLKSLQGWETPPTQPVPMPDHPLSEEFSPLNPPWHNLRPFSPCPVDISPAFYWCSTVVTLLLLN